VAETVDAADLKFQVKLSTSHFSYKTVFCITLYNGHSKLNTGDEAKVDFSIGTFLAPKISFSLGVRDNQKGVHLCVRSIPLSGELSFNPHLLAP